MNKEKLKSVANAIFTTGYGVGVLSQDLHDGYRKLTKLGRTDIPFLSVNIPPISFKVPYFSVYDQLPFGGHFLYNYGTSFLGAYACAYVAQAALEIPPLKTIWNKNRERDAIKTETAIALSAATLTTYEATIGYHNSFDWMDMGAYTLAWALFYLINKHRKPANDAGRPSASPLPAPEAP